jgi:hypothetical protein
MVSLAGLFRVRLIAYCVLPAKMNTRWGVVSFADSLDCVGIIGKNVACTEQIFSPSFFPNCLPLLISMQTIYHSMIQRIQQLLHLIHGQRSLEFYKSFRENMTSGKGTTASMEFVSVYHRYE